MDAVRKSISPGAYGLWSALQWTEHEIAKGNPNATLVMKRQPDDLPRNHESIIRSSLGHQLAVIEAPGKIRIGSNPSDHEQDLDEPVRELEIAYDFAIAIHEVTQSQFDAFLKSRGEASRPYQQQINPEFSGPALRVSWYAAAAYCNWLSNQDRIPPEQWCYRPNSNGEYAAGMTLVANYQARAGYRLPTAAEWEYACRTGVGDGTRFFGDSVSVLSEYAWHSGNSAQRAHGVGQLMPNAFGLHDVMGNAWEWCNDPYPQQGRVTDAHRVTDNIARELRGGSWQTGSRALRSAERHAAFAGEAGADFGFRLVRTVRPESKADLAGIDLSDWRYRAPMGQVGKRFREVGIAVPKKCGR